MSVNKEPDVTKRTKRQGNKQTTEKADTKQDRRETNIIKEKDINLNSTYYCGPVDACWEDRCHTDDWAPCNGDIHTLQQNSHPP